MTHDSQIGNVPFNAMGKDTITFSNMGSRETDYKRLFASSNTKAPSWIDPNSRNICCLEIYKPPKTPLGIADLIVTYVYITIEISF